jgi:HTH-type transcriptional regulator/antitoxin HigA
MLRKGVMIATESYQALIARFPLRPIRDEATLEAASSLADELLRRRDLTIEEADYLEVLSDQIERYEDAHHEIPDASPAEVLRYLMEAREMTGAALATATGLPRSLISEVLNGTRGLSKARIATLAEFFGVPADSFL